MRRPITRMHRVALAGALALTASLTSGSNASATDTAIANECLNTEVTGTHEERRIPNGIDGGPSVAQQIMVRSEFMERVTNFQTALCPLASDAEATAFVQSQGAGLWQAATARAQAADRGGNWLRALDDRGLYWARLAMSLALRQWQPAFALSEATRTELIRTLEFSSRGIDTSQFSPDVKKVFVTGFDPFGLDPDTRVSNPSGAAALSLDGQQWVVDGQTYEFQTAIFPVRYADFEQQIVEKALTPHYQAGPQHADMVMTVSQGGSAFELEIFNGRRRAYGGDNNQSGGGGTPNSPIVAPGMPAGPEWLRSTLPVDAMSTADTSPASTYIDTSVVEIPAGSAAPVGRSDGPTEGSIAVDGSGGGFLSNEIAYRNTLLREAYDTTMPAGHLHIPGAWLDSGNRTEITDPTFEANLVNAVRGVHAIVYNGLPR